MQTSSNGEIVELNGFWSQRQINCCAVNAPGVVDRRDFSAGLAEALANASFAAQASTHIR
jgi:hypothetical protein